jgi:hypothetical protein
MDGMARLTGKTPPRRVHIPTIFSIHHITGKKLLSKGRLHYFIPDEILIFAGICTFFDGKK